MTAQGWECPRCGSVYGPQVTKCTNPDCKPRRRVDVTPKGDDDEEVLGEEISGDDLHDQLYRPSIQFPSSASSKRRRRGGGGGGPDTSDGSSGVF
jgi:hypothetical protein